GAAVRRLPDAAAVLRDVRDARVLRVERDRVDATGHEPEREARCLAARARLRLGPERLRGRERLHRLRAGADPRGADELAVPGAVEPLRDADLHALRLLRRRVDPALVEATGRVRQTRLPELL